MPRGRQRARRARGRGKAVNGFLRPHTGREAARIANYEAGAEYNPKIRELRQASKGSRKHLQNIGSYYNKLAQDYGDAQQAGLAAFQTAQDTTAQQLAAASARSGEQIASLAKDDEDFAKLVGGPKDTAGLQEIAKAAAAADRARVAINAPTAQEQANYLASLGGYKAASRMQGIEARRDERRNRAKIKSDLTDTRREKAMTRVARKEQIREGDRAERAQRAQERLAKREFTDPKPYDEAILAQAQMGLEGDVASANAQTGAASIYAGADRRTAKATERAAAQARRGREATAEGQTQTAKIYGKDGGSSGGYNTREALALAESKGHFKSPRAMLNYLVNRGVDLSVARAAVKQATGGGSRRQARQPSSYSRRQHEGRVAQPGVPKGPRQTVRRKRR